jgi:hypothetical protein
MQSLYGGFAVTINIAMAVRPFAMLLSDVRYESII